MSDINELVHAIRLAERLAEGVAREDEVLSFEHLVNVRKALAEATIHIEMAALRAGVDLIDDHAEVADRLCRAMISFAKADGIEVATDPYADLPETEVEFDDGRVVRLKATEADLRVLAAKLREGERDERVGDELYAKLQRANLALTEAKMAARQCEGFEPELRYLFATDPAIRARVREMAAARTKAA